MVPLQLWPRAGVDSVRVCPQRVQVQVVEPAAVQVGAVVTPPSQLWPRAGVASV